MGLKQINRRSLTGLLAIGLLAALYSSGQVFANPPTVNGLFYGDDDYTRYSGPYSESIGGSKVYVYFDTLNRKLYVALVVDRSVNDNVFGNRDYTTDAGWGPPHTARRLTDSEFAEFTLIVDNFGSWNWLQGYAGQPDDPNNNTNPTWVSNENVGGGDGAPTPPDYQSSSSFVWNLNNYATNPSPNWNMDVNGSSITDWKSPFDAVAPNVVLGLEGYPATGDITYSSFYQWEWAMVYEWSVDLTGAGPDPVYVIVGSSHHSPAKSGPEDDHFTPGDDPLTDFGDLPAPYSTLLADDGPRHNIVTGGAFLGLTIDPEPDGQPTNLYALGDDLTGVNDEDGVVLLTDFPAGGTATFEITVGVPGYVSAFIDWNSSGALDPVNIVSVTGPTAVASGNFGDTYFSMAGVYEVTVDVPADASGEIYARFRITNETGQGGNSPTGLAPTGEVEDYVFLEPTHVVLSRFEVIKENGTSVVVWETASEQDTLGFNILRREAGAAGRSGYERLNDELLPGLMNWPVGGEYRFIDAAASPGVAYEYALEEIETRGRKIFHGPFAADAAVASMSASVSISDEGKAPAFSSRHVIQRSSAPAFAGPGGIMASDLVRIAVRESGVHRIGVSEIASAAGASESTVRRHLITGRIRLTNRGSEVAWLPDGEGLLFYGESIDSIYTWDNIYWLELSSTRSARIGSVRSPWRRMAAGAPGLFDERLDFGEDAVPAPGAYFNADDNFWLWKIALAIGAQRRSMIFPFDAPGYAGGTAEIRIRLKGLTDLDDVADHFAEIFLNEEKIGEAVWDGYGTPELTLPVAAGLLKDGANSLEVKVGAAPGATYSYSGVDGFSVLYNRRMIAVNGVLEFVASGPGTVSVAGFGSSDIMIWDITDPGRPVSVERSGVSLTKEGYAAALSPFSGRGRYIAFTAGAVLSPVGTEVGGHPGLKNISDGASYVVIAPRALLPGAEALAAYRAGRDMTAMAVAVEDIYDSFSHGIADPRAISDFLKHAGDNWSQAPAYVVLAGRGSYDYRDIRGFGDCLLPAMPWATKSGIIETDGRYADLSGDGLPDLAVGRIPALSNAELLGFLAKLSAYESGGDWRNNVIISADIPDKGGQFTSDSEKLAGMVTGEYNVRRIYMEGMTTSAARDNLFEALEDGAGVMSYLGHAGFDRLSSRGLLTSGDAPGLDNGQKAPILLAGTCTFNRSGAPGFRSLGETLTLSPSGGVVASWAPVTLAWHRENKPLIKGAFESLFGGGSERLGDALLYSMDSFRESKGDSAPLYTISLLGDPATAIWSPLEEELLDEFTVSGYAFRDEDGDGLFNPVDSGLSGLPVSLSGVDDNGDPVNLSTVTDDSGRFEFVAPAGLYTLSLNAADTLAIYPELADATTSLSYAFALVDGEEAYNFGFEESSGPAPRWPIAPPGRGFELPSSRPYPPGRSR